MLFDVCLHDKEMACTLLNFSVHCAQCYKISKMCTNPDNARFKRPVLAEPQGGKLHPGK